MAQSLLANLQAFNKQLSLDLIEQASEVFDLFNRNSNGAILLADGDIMGAYSQLGYWLRRNTVSRRDQTSSAARTPAGHTMDEMKTITLARAVNDDQTVSALRKQGLDPAVVSRGMARGMAEDILLDAFTVSLAGLVGTMLKQSTTYNDDSALSSSNTISLANCWDTMQLLGDAQQNVVAVLMHSYQATALKKSLAASTAVGQTLGAGVVRDDVLTGHFMRPVFVTDNAYLKVDKTSASGAYDTYRTMFLTGVAAEVKKMQTVEIEAYIDRAYDNAMLGITGEHELELRIKGFSYTHGTANPATSALATTSNWTKKCTSIKDGPGAILITR